MIMWQVWCETNEKKDDYDDIDKDNGNNNNNEMKQTEKENDNNNDNNNNDDNVKCDVKQAKINCKNVKQKHKDI